MTFNFGDEKKTQSTSSDAQKYVIIEKYFTFGDTHNANFRTSQKCLILH